MSAFRALRQLNALSCHVLERRTVSSVTRSRFPTLCTRMPMTSFGHRPFTVSARRLGEGTTDLSLTQKLGEELQYEKEANADSSEPEFLAAFKAEGIWQVEDTPGHDEITLTRKFGNENIRMIFSISDLQALNEEDGEYEDEEKSKEGEDASASSEEHPVNSYPIRVSFSISKTSGPGVLNVDTACQQASFVVDNLSFYPDKKSGMELTAEADWLRRGLYIGPQFDSLDVTVQEEFDKWLSERGINESLALFVMDYAEYKEQKEYVRWLQNVKTFIDL